MEQAGRNSAWQDVTGLDSPSPTLCQLLRDRQDLKN
jgi:hypothetical protein